MRVRPWGQGYAFMKIPAASFHVVCPFPAPKAPKLYRFILQHILHYLLTFTPSFLRRHSCKPMDAYGLHAADLCTATIGRLHQDNTTRNALVACAVRVTDLNCEVETPFHTQVLNSACGHPNPPTSQRHRFNSFPLTCDLANATALRPARGRRLRNPPRRRSRHRTQEIGRAHV